MQLITYRLSDGQILRSFDSNTQALLDAQRDPNDATVGYYSPDPPLSPQDLRMVEVVDGALHTKTQLTIEWRYETGANPSTDHVYLKVTPSVPCTLLVNTQAVPLTAQIPEAMFQNPVLGTYVVTLAPMPGYWADPVWIVLA